jgi:hypothetical protein
MYDLRFSRRWLRRMVSSGMLRRVALVWTDVLEEPDASFIRVTRICEIGTTQGATRNRHVFLHSVRRLLVAACVVPSSPIFSPWWRRRQVSPKPSVLTRATRRNITEGTILHRNVPISLILVSLLMELLGSSEKALPTEATRRKNPEDGILHSHLRETLKSYIDPCTWGCHGEN